MKINRVIGWMLVLCVGLSVGFSVSPDLALAKPKVTTHYFGGSARTKYYSISGSKYDKANAAMKKYAKAEYARNQDAMDLYDEGYKAIVPESSPTDFYCRVSPKVKYSAHGKLSILYTESWFAGGVLSTNYKSFNLYKGRSITLAKAFRSKAKYSSASSKAQEYWRLKWRQEGLYERPWASETKLANHEFYWTKRGITVIYESGSLGSHADGERRYSVAKSYLKY